jgi:hypothetical protein
MLMGGDGRSVGYAFISCSAVDAAAAEVVRGALELADIEVWRDSARILLGEDWRAAMRRAVSEGALVFVVLFSRAGLDAERSRHHEELNVAIEELRRRAPLVPWLVPVRVDDCEIPDLEIGAGRTLRSLESADVFGPRRSEEIGRLVAAVTRIQTMRARLSAVGPVPAFGLVSDPAQRGDVPGHASRLTRNGLSPLVGWRTIPESTPAFTDREGVLLRLRAQLKTEETALVPQVLCGLGGVGKTQLAIQYAWRFREEYDLIWWVNAEQHSQVISGLGDLGELMDLPVPESQQHGARAVLNALSEHTVYARWLMIYDNARSPDLVLPYVPHGAGHVLITSQSQEWLAAGKVIPVDVFTREDSVELLRSFRGD